MPERRVRSRQFGVCSGVHFDGPRLVHLYPIRSHVVHLSSDDAVEHDGQQAKQRDTDGKADQQQEPEDLEASEVGVLGEHESEYQGRNCPDKSAEDKKVYVPR